MQTANEIAPRATRLGANIQRRRQELNWTLRDLAATAHVGLGPVANIENGITKNPGILTVTKIADALDVSILKLIE